MRYAILSLTAAAAVLLHFEAVEAAHWEPFEPWMADDPAASLDLVRIVDGDEGPILCTSKGWKNGAGIMKQGRRVGYIKDGECKTVGAGKNIRKLSDQEDGLIEVLRRDGHSDLHWVPIEELTDDQVTVSIKNELPPGNHPRLCTSKPWANGRGIKGSDRRVGFLGKNGNKCKTVGNGPKMRRFSKDDGMLMVLAQSGHGSDDYYMAEHDDEGEEHSNDTEFDSAIAFVGCNYWGSRRSGVDGVQVVTWDECHDAAAEGGYEWFGLNWGGHKKEGKGGCHLSNAALPPVDGSQCQEVTDEAGHYLGHSQFMAIYSQGGVSGAEEIEESYYDGDSDSDWGDQDQGSGHFSDDHSWTDPDMAEHDDELAEIVEAWPELSDKVKARLLKIVKKRR